MVYALAAEKRDVVGKRAKRLLSDDRMPAVVYGPTEASTPITVSASAFAKTLRDAGESSVIELTGLDKPLQVLIHEVYHDPVTSRPLHADLYAIEKGAKVEIAVPLEFVGESPAVKQGANLVKVMHELEIEAAPADLPQEIAVDISALAAIGDQLHVSDLVLPKGVVSKAEPDQVVVLIQEVEEETEEVTAPVDMSAIEVEKKGKDEEAAEGEAKAE